MATVGFAEECPLPVNARWCQVRLGGFSHTFNMAVYTAGDIVSDTICNTGSWEVGEADVKALGTPGHALDIGANVGYYSLVLALWGWKVSAFEPLAANNALIEASLCANPAFKHRITLNKFGLGSKNDHCILVSGVSNIGDGWTRCGADAAKFVDGQGGYQTRGTMEIRRLDDVLVQQGVQKINFVKMDVEGFECQVMAGGQSLLTKFRPRIIQSEVWNKMQGCRPEDYLGSFKKASYTVASDRACTQPDLSRPVGIVDRFMCRDAKVSLLESNATLGPNERRIVWLNADQ